MIYNFSQTDPPGCQAAAIGKLVQEKKSCGRPDQDRQAGVYGRSVDKALIRWAALLTCLSWLYGGTADAIRGDIDIPDKLFAGTTVPEQAQAVAQTASAPHEKLISPPGEDPYFPVRTDGQPYVLNVDSSINLTSALNHFYWDPKWRGEVWSPFDQPELAERAQRLMALWPEYDGANVFRVGTGINQWLERFSGFGPQ
jgi:hypothetical protein